MKKLLLFFAVCWNLPAACGSYAHCRAITFRHSLAGSSDTTNFAALISGTYDYLAVVGSGGSVQNTTTQTGGGTPIAVPADLILTSDSGCANKLNWEFETYVSSSGGLNIWVNIGTLSHTSDNVIYLCYGNPAAATWQGNVGGTWDSSYLAVYHLPDGAVLSGNDSTANASHASATAGITAVAGPVDGAAHCNGGSGEQITLGNSPAFSNPGGMLTLSAWANFTPSTEGSIIAKYTGLGSGEYVLGPLSGLLYFWVADDAHMAYLGRHAPYPYLGWHHVAGVYAGGSSTSSTRIYVDGVQVDDADFAGGAFASMQQSSAVANIGGANGGLGGPLFGYIDEARISGTARSADQILAEYNNQSNPGAFYAVGPDLAGTSSPAAAKRRILN